MAYGKYEAAIFEHVKSLGKTPMVWEDVINLGVTIPSNVVVQPWQCWDGVGGCAYV